MNRSMLGVRESSLDLEHIRRLFQEGFIELEDYERWSNGNGVLIVHDTGVVYISNTMLQGVYDFIKERNLDLCYFSTSKYTGIHHSMENIFCVCKNHIGSRLYYSVAYNPDMPNSQAGKDTEIVQNSMTLVEAFTLVDILSEVTEFNTKPKRFSEITLHKFKLNNKGIKLDGEQVDWGNYYKNSKEEDGEDNCTI